MRRFFIIHDKGTEMSIYQLTEPVLERDFRWFFDNIADMIDVLVEPLGTGKVSLPAIPRRIGRYSVPYAFAGRIRLMLDYACGKQSLSRDYIQETSASFCKMVTLSFVTWLEPPVEEDDDDDVDGENREEAILLKYRSHPIAQVILAARGRLAILEKRRLSEAEFITLTGLAKERAEAAGVKVYKSSHSYEFDYLTTLNILKSINSSHNEE